MRWKKNGLSYLIWFIYLLTVVFGLFCLANASCGVLGFPFYWGIALGLLWLSLAGVAVYGRHALGAAENRGNGPGAGERIGDGRGAAMVAEASLTVILLAVGLILRVNSLDAAGQGAAYYEAASVIPGRSMPEIAHGASYLYVWLLHGIFYFLGNKMIIGVFCQILLQLLALLLLYLAVRRLAGKIGGMVFLSLGVLSGYLGGEALTLSPGMLYLVIWAAVLLWTLTGERETVSAPRWLLTGVFLGIVCYLDIAGVILLPVAVAAIYRRRKRDVSSSRKAAALALCVSGLLAGFTAALAAAAVSRGRHCISVLQEWAELYLPESFRIPAGPGEARFAMEYLVLAALMSLGIFGFWRDRESESLKGWAPVFAAAVLLGVFGCSTAELPVSLFLYVLAGILAGVSVEECFRPTDRVEPDGMGAGRTKRKAEADRPAGRAEPDGVRREEAPESGGIQFIENPLPLPKKHVSRRLDYDVSGGPQDDYDLTVDDSDDFDI